MINTTPHPAIQQLASCSFVERHENVLIVGSQASGKTTAARYICERAEAAGYKVAMTDGALVLRGSLRRQFPDVDLLVIDGVDMGRRLGEVLRDANAAVCRTLYSETYLPPCSVIICALSKDVLSKADVNLVHHVVNLEKETL